MSGTLKRVLCSSRRQEMEGSAGERRAQPSEVRWVWTQHYKFCTFHSVDSVPICWFLRGSGSETRFPPPPLKLGKPNIDHFHYQLDYSGHCTNCHVTMETVGAMVCACTLMTGIASIRVHLRIVSQCSPWEVSTWKHQCSMSNTTSWGEGRGRPVASLVWRGIRYLYTCTEAVQQLRNLVKYRKTILAIVFIH